MAAPRHGDCPHLTKLKEFMVAEEARSRVTSRLMAVTVTSQGPAANPAGDGQEKLQCLLCVYISLGETTVGVWEHLLSAQPIWLPLFPPGSAHWLSLWHAYELPPVSAPEQTNWFLPRRNLNTTDWTFFQGATEEPGMRWTRLYPGQSSSHPRRPHAHCPPCCAVEPKMPSDPADKHHAGRLPPSPFTT